MWSDTCKKDEPSASLKIIIIIIHCEFYKPILTCDISLTSEWLQVSSDLQDYKSILADVNNTVVSVISVLPLISNYANLFSKLLGTVPSTSITIAILLQDSNINNILLFWEFFKPMLADGFTEDLSDSKSPQVSMTLLSILADLDKDVVWMVSPPVPVPTLWWLYRVHQL